MDNEITKEEFEETNRKVQSIFQQIEEETLQKMPLWMRMNYFMNKISKAFKNGHTDADIKWDYVNEMCTNGLGELDYNLYKPVYSLVDFDGERFNVIAAQSGIGQWQKHKCKDCGEEFYLTYSEMNFYSDRGLALPKRCKQCRDKRKKGN